MRVRTVVLTLALCFVGVAVCFAGRPRLGEVREMADVAPSGLDDNNPNLAR